nr:hypothetical protein BCU06_11740 [Vibrio breoganii]
MKFKKNEFVVLGNRSGDFTDDSSLWGDISMINCKSYTKFDISFQLFKHLSKNKSDLIHVHGLWSFNGAVALIISLICGNKIILSPHGMLDPWALKQSTFKKRLVNLIFGKRLIFNSSCIHALCKSELDSIRALGYKNPVAIIPNGIDLPHLDSSRKRTKLSKRKQLVFLGRIHRKKGISELLESWNRLSNRYGQNFEWELVIAGWDDDDLADTINDFSDSNKTIKYIGPVFGEHKQELLESSDAFVLPSYSEGLPMSILEAWSYSVPVIMTDFCNLPEGFAHNAALRIEPNVNSIVSGLERLINMASSDLRQIGLNGRSLVEKDFTWDKVASDMISVYKWSLDKDSIPPSCIDIVKE